MPTLGEQVAGLTATVAAMKEALDNHTTTVSRAVQNHEVRIRKMEHHLAWVLGAGAGAGTVGGIVAGLLIRVIGG